MRIRFPVSYTGLIVGLLLFTTACQAQATPVAVIASPVAVPTDTSVPPTPVFLGAVPVALPSERLDRAGDVDSSPNAYKKLVSGGDEFVHGLFERPFNANTMDTYFPYLDIVETQGFIDDTWGYGTITLEGTDKNGALPGQYALELDLNRDGRGDWLILAKSVSGTDWSASGVQAWNEPDTDIGGQYAMVADNKPQGVQGYENLVFDEGKGELVDGAWARIKPDDPKTVEIAFKLAMMGDPSLYAMGAWAGTKIDPAMFDYNDAMSHAEAGSPLPSYKVYPLQALAEVDNTCRLAIGFAPTGKEPGLCATNEKRQSEGGGSGGEYCFVTGSGFVCVPVP